MANKMYEEAYIQAIANAIREKNGSTNTYKVSEMASGIASIQTGATEENRLVFTGTITETVVGSLEYVVLAKSSKLAEIRNEIGLFVRVEFEINPTPYTIVKNWALNNAQTIPTMDTQFQRTHRYGADGSDNYGNIVVPVDTDSPESVGCVQITEDGELRIYSNSSSNYAIRPSNYTVIVEW